MFKGNNKITLNIRLIAMDMRTSVCAAFCQFMWSWQPPSLFSQFVYGQGTLDLKIECNNLSKRVVHCGIFFTHILSIMKMVRTCIVSIPKNTTKYVVREYDVYSSIDGGSYKVEDLPFPVVKLMYWPLWISIKDW